MGVPGCPELACWTASIESVRIVLIDSVSSGSLAEFTGCFTLRSGAMVGFSPGDSRMPRPGQIMVKASRGSEFDAFVRQGRAELVQVLEPDRPEAELLGG